MHIKWTAFDINSVNFHEYVNKRFLYLTGRNIHTQNENKDNDFVMNVRKKFFNTKY